MRVAPRLLFAVLCTALIGGAMAALAGSRADFPGREAAFHTPHHPSPVIETAPVSTTSASADEWIAAPLTGRAPRVSFGTRVADHRPSRAIAPAPDTALDQRPPPSTSLA